MGFFTRSVQPDTSPTDADGSGFLHPESSLESNRALETSAWSKERSAQQYELEDVHNRQNIGCCRKSIEFLVKALHVINDSGAIAMIVYGSLICTQFDQPAMAAVLFCLLLGSFHLLTSSLGILSYAVSGCSRYGLVVSAYSGPYFALAYLTMLISLLVDSSGFLQYLDDNKEVMYLGDNVAENCKRLLPLFYTILIVLGLLEVARFPVLIKLQEQLLQHDAAEALIPRSSHHTESGSANKTLTEALLADNKAERVETASGDGGGGVGKETTGTPNWWEGK